MRLVMFLGADFADAVNDFLAANASRVTVVEEGEEHSLESYAVFKEYLAIVEAKMTVRDATIHHHEARQRERERERERERAFIAHRSSRTRVTASLHRIHRIVSVQPPIRVVRVGVVTRIPR